MIKKKVKNGIFITLMNFTVSIIGEKENVKFLINLFIDLMLQEE